MSQKIVNVAVAILHYQDQYLLGYRNANQHQGNKYEFIGGKIESSKNGRGETPKQGLIREVFEEIGCDISQNIAVKMGIIRHNYSDKSVALHCFKIELNQSQFEQLQSEIGKEGQAITWVKRVDLLAKKYPLPEANAHILDWLTLPEAIFISQSLSSFNNHHQWLNFYTKNLPNKAVFYGRLQAKFATSFLLISKLLEQRNDLIPLIPLQLWQHYPQNFESKNCIIHLTHADLMTLDCARLNHQQYFASCHDEESIAKVNQLAKMHTVMGCFISPVLPTPTHPESVGLGWDKFSELAQMCDVPVYALGGMGLEHLSQVQENNGFGVAGIRLIESILNGR